MTTLYQHTSLSVGCGASGYSCTPVCRYTERLIDYLHLQATCRLADFILPKPFEHAGLARLVVIDNSPCNIIRYYNFIWRPTKELKSDRRGLPWKTEM
jgi:hypothetical protein